MKRNIAIIIFITFLDYLSLSVFFGTVLPLVYAKHSVFPLAISHYDKSLLYGFVILILPLGQFLVAPLWGQLADQYGRKAILFITLLGSAFGYWVICIAISTHIFWLFVLARIITAMMGVNTAIGQASLADISHGTQKTLRFNWQFVALSLGFIVGPYLITYSTKSIYYANAYWVLVGGYLLAFVVVLFLFRETLLVVSREKLKRMLNFERIFVIFREPFLKQLLLIWIVFQLGWSLFFQYSGEFLYQAKYLTNDHINHIFAWLGVGAFLVQIIVVPFMAAKILPSKIIPWSILALAVSLIGMGLVPINASFYLLLGLYCFGIGFFLPNMYAHISNNTSASQQGRVMATMMSCQGLMDITVTFAGSFIVALYLPTPFIFGGAIIFISLLVWLLCKRS